MWKIQVGELEGVQLLLDCSQIDGKNPLISQWVILSVKALCDKHPENQNILFNLRRQGAADSTLLKELGLRLPAET
ncbi:ataxin-10 [Eurytemora carolleeae]|uniref:ataxin-10 n=1 Tax=Eurytemora carolleeae TaxID=1294199 RepID=UPI000C75DEB5|nr:ataxin-10 [Eurytemora carolleeae]|eukprot:XP_023340250.1 ataxin-10-like [Eurytemora affinis]